MTVTFDYYCAQCDAPFCERVNLLNLALDYEDSGFCLTCLTVDQQAANPRALVLQLLPYINSRDCFKKPWHEQTVTLCPRLADATCYCQDA
jgi:hypothetical protein